MSNPKLIKWARERADLTVEQAEKKIGSKKYQEWETGKSQPTMKQLEKIAKKFYCPLGYLFLEKAPEEKLPIPDFRTPINQELSHKSIDLLDTIYDAQRKQSWLREKKINDDEDKLIPKQKLTDSQIVEKVKNLLDIEGERKKAKSYEEYLRALIKKLDDKSFLAIRNGMVGNNTHRPLDKDEFKGFALFDEYAPLIFINGKDYKSSQIFTLAHELVHLFLNESGVDGDYNLQTEQRCNKLAAEILLPSAELENFELKNIENIAKTFKVSVFVVLIKAKQLGHISKNEFEAAWREALEDVSRNSQNKRSSGGDYFATTKFKAGGEQFLLRVYFSTMAGETLYKDAYALTGLKDKTFAKYYNKALGI